MQLHYKVKPLYILLLETSAYVKSYNGQTKWTHFLIEDDDLLEKYITIWDKVSAAYKFFFSKTRIKSHGNKVTIFL